MKKLFKTVVTFLTIVAVAEVMVYNVHFINKALNPKPAPMTIMQKLKATVGIKPETPPEPTILERVDKLMFQVGVFKEIPKADEESNIAKLWDSSKQFATSSWEKTKTTTGHAWNATKDFSSNIYEKGKSLLHSDK